MIEQRLETLSESKAYSPSNRAGTERGETHGDGGPHAAGNEWIDSGLDT